MIDFKVTNEITPMPDLPAQFVFSICAHLGDRIYLVGGDGSGSTMFYIYDIAAETWTPGPDFPVPAKGSVGTLVGDRFLVFCQKNDLVYEYDETATAWVQYSGPLDNFHSISGLVMVDDSHINC